MDKYEYRVKTEQMMEFVENRQYQKAMEIADTVEWRRVKNPGMLNTVSEIYEYCGEYQKSRDVLFVAFDRSPNSKKIVYRLGTLALKLGDTAEATDCYEEFVKIAPKDPNQYILKYKILKEQGSPLEEQIHALEEFKQAEYIEKWAYELAKLYQKAGMTKECIDECDDLILWFSEGRYVTMAMQLKMQYKPLTPLQQEKYQKRMGKSTELELPEEEEQAVEDAAPAAQEELLAEVPVEETPVEEVPMPSVEDLLKELEAPAEEEPEVPAEEVPAEEKAEIPEEKKPVLMREVIGKTVTFEPIYDVEETLAELSEVPEEAQPEEAAAEDAVEAAEETVAEPVKEPAPAPAPARKSAIMSVVSGASLEEALANTAAQMKKDEKASRMKEEAIRISTQMKIDDLLKEWEDKQKDNKEAIEKQREADEKRLRIEREEAERRIEEERRKAEETARRVQEEAERKAAEEAARKAAEEAEQKAREEAERKAAIEEEKRRARRAEMEAEARRAAEELETRKALEALAMEEPEDEITRSILEEKTKKLPDDILELMSALGNRVAGQETPAAVSEAEEPAPIPVAETEGLLTPIDEDGLEEDFDEEDFEETDFEETDFDEAEFDEAAFEEEEPASESLDEDEFDEEDFEEEFSEDTVEAEDADEEDDFEEEGSYESEEYDEDDFEDDDEDDDDYEAVDTDEEDFDEEALEEEELDEDEFDEDEFDEDEFDEDEFDEDDFIEDEDEFSEDEDEVEFDEEDFDEDEFEEEDFDEDEFDEEELGADEIEEVEMEEEPAEEAKPEEEHFGEKELADSVASLEIKEPTEEEIQKRIHKSKGGVPFDTGFVVTGRYDLSATSEIGLKAGLTEEQKKLFSYFVPVRGMSEQIVEVLDNDRRAQRGGTSKTGNVLVIGNKGSGKTVLAVDVVKAIQKQRNLKQGKVAIVTGESLNKKDLSAIVQKLRSGAIIIEKAGKLNAKTIGELNELMEQKTGELLFVLEDQKKPLERLMTAHPDFKKKFTSRLELPVFINDELVTFGQTYAKENGYKLDEMGILALYSRIDVMQREDHAVSVAEVKDIMDAAIAHSQKANIKHLARRVFGKKGEDELIILKEEDFKV